MMIEVETKIKIDKPELYRKEINRISKFIGKEKKIDDYYTLEDGERYPKKSLRIRKIGSKVYQINFKKRISYKNGVHAKNEVEFFVSNINDFLKLIGDFGFRKWLRKEKSSEIYFIDKSFHIEINNVKHIGWFLEIEYLCKEKNVIGLARRRVLDIVRKLGFKKKDLIGEGYTKMLWDIGKIDLS